MWPAINNINKSQTQVKYTVFLDFAIQHTPVALSLMKISWSQWPSMLASVSGPILILPTILLEASPIPRNGCK